MTRTIFAVFGGFLIAALIGYGVEYVNSSFWLPEGVNWFSMEDMREIIPTLPPIAALPNLIGAMLGLYVGAWAAGRISHTGSRAPGYMVTGLIIVQGLIPNFIVGTPLWGLAVGILLMLLSGYFGTKAGTASHSGRRQESPTL